jgi:transcriptional regulator with XRE-family HTH domain
MSIFGATLLRLLSLEDMSQLELARRSGVEGSLISRISHGRPPSREQLGRLLAGISNDRERQLELLFAHLRDEAESAKMAGITEDHYRLESAANVHGAKPGTLAAELELIGAECLAHDDVRQLVIEMARMIRRHNAELLDASGGPGTVYPIFSDSSAVVAESRPSRVRRSSKSEGRPRSIGPVPKPPAAG